MARKAKLAQIGNRKSGRKAKSPDASEPALPKAIRRGRKPKPEPTTAALPDAEPVMPSPTPSMVSMLEATPKARRGRALKQVEGVNASPPGLDMTTPDPEAIDTSTEAAAEMPKRRRGRAPAVSAASELVPTLSDEPATPIPSSHGGTEAFRHEEPASSSSTPQQAAAHWDRVADKVTFDWSAIERTAAEEGPNQAMAKLLLAARAEGATSRWPF